MLFPKARKTNSTAQKSRIASILKSVFKVESNFRIPRYDDGEADEHCQISSTLKVKHNGKYLLRSAITWENIFG